MMTSQNKTCTWKGKVSKTGCRRTTYNSEYCLFHKPNKNEYEAKIFWKVINWAGADERGIDVMSIPMYRTDIITEKDKAKISEHIKQSNLNNFTLEEQRDEGFDSLYKEVKNQTQIADLWVRNTGIFDGFVFPVLFAYGTEFNYKNKLPFVALSFQECVFEGGVFFNNLNFLSEVYFDNAVFKNTVNFFNTRFFSNVSFKNTNFNAGISSDLDLFYKTEFNGHKVDFTNTKLASVGTIEFGNHTKIILNNVDFGGRVSLAETLYRIAKVQSLTSGNYDLASKYAYEEMKVKGNSIKLLKTVDNSQNRIVKICNALGFTKKLSFKKLFHLIADRFYRYIFGYGEKPSRVLLFSALVIFIFSVIYYCLTCQTYGESLFISATTFSTFGFGIPLEPYELNGWLKLVFVMESLMGAFTLGAFVAVMLRRFR